MKKLFFLPILFLLFSCSPDDKEEKPISNPTFDVDLLLKGWRYDTIKIDGILYNYQHNSFCYQDHFGFLNRPGQERMFVETTFTNDYCTNNSINMEWKIKKDKIYLYFGKPLVLTYKVVLLSENQFVFSFETDIDQDGTIDNVEISSTPYDPYDMYNNN